MIIDECDAERTIKFKRAPKKTMATRSTHKPFGQSNFDTRDDLQVLESVGDFDNWGIRLATSVSILCG